jgi:uncharacterized phage protein (TIGR01671 family)
MTREIKFKAYHKPTKRIFDVYSFTPELVFEDSLDGIGTSATLPAKRKDCVLMQFTGYFDKNGVEIYEDYILRYKYSYSEPLIHPVVYWKSGFYVDDKCKLGLLSLSWIVEQGECEAIGNIHQNHNFWEANNALDN